MTRRSFVKLLGMTALAASLPIDILVDNRDDETKMFEKLLNIVDDELIVISFVKEYCYFIAEVDPKSTTRCITASVVAFRDRQPNLIKWLRSRIDVKAKSGRWYEFKRYLNFENTAWRGYSLFFSEIKKYPGLGNVEQYPQRWLTREQFEQRYS